MIKHYALSSEEMKQIRQKFGEHRYSSCPTWFDFFPWRKEKDDEGYAHSGHVIILKIDDGFQCLFYCRKTQKGSEPERTAFYDFAAPTLDGVLVILQMLLDKHDMK